MRVSPTLFRLSPRLRWGPLLSSVQRIPPNPTSKTSLEEQPTLSFGKKGQEWPPSWRKFKPSSHFSIYKMDEIKRSVEDAGSYKLVFFAPVNSLTRIKDAIFATGAGTLGGGRYTRCCFQTLGTGQFRPEVGAAPTIGELGVTEVVEEMKCEILCKGKKITKAAVRALLHTHPYEVPAYEVYLTEMGFEPHQLVVAREPEHLDDSRKAKVTRRISSQLARSERIKSGIEASAQPEEGNHKHSESSIDTDIERQQTSS